MTYVIGTNLKVVHHHYYRNKNLHNPADPDQADQILRQFVGHTYFKHGHSRCLTNGNYDPIQCIPYPGIEGQCVCVVVYSDGNDNHLNPNGTTQFQSNIQNLKCFDENIHVPEYYRPCEKVIYEIEVSYSLPSR